MAYENVYRFIKAHPARYYMIFVRSATQVAGIARLLRSLALASAVLFGIGMRAGAQDDRSAQHMLPNEGPVTSPAGVTRKTAAYSVDSLMPRGPLLAGIPRSASDNAESAPPDVDRWKVARITLYTTLALFVAAISLYVYAVYRYSASS